MSECKQCPKQHLWREEFSVASGESSLVERRQFARFLTLASFGMFCGQLWLLAKTLFAKQETPPNAMTIAGAQALPVGGVKIFQYPTPQDNCLLIRVDSDRYVAYSQKCTHLSCAVYYSATHRRIECPCHEGYFSITDGRVLQGPPPRPLPQITLARRGDEIVATGIRTGEEL